MNKFINVNSHNTHMANITLSLSDNIYKKIKKHKEIKWSEVARSAIEMKLKELEEADYRKYSLKRLSEEGEDAREIFDF